MNEIKNRMGYITADVKRTVILNMQLILAHIHYYLHTSQKVYMNREMSRIFYAHITFYTSH